MATEAANAERHARAQNKIDASVERIAKALNVGAPPRTRQDQPKEVRAAAEAERQAAFLELVANHVDPSNAGKGVPDEQSLSGFGEYSALNEQQRKEAERQRLEEIQTQGVTDEAREERVQPAAGQPVQQQSSEDEPHFAGRPLSEFDSVPDDQLTEQDGVGEVTAKEIVKARRKRDRKAGR